MARGAAHLIVTPGGLAPELAHFSEHEDEPAVHHGGHLCRRANGSGSPMMTCKSTARCRTAFASELSRIPLATPS